MSLRRMKKYRCGLFATSVLMVAASTAQAFDVVVQASVVEKALKAQLFKDQGRYYLRKPDACNDPYLESPAVSFRQGRIYIGAHLAGRIGANVGGVCRSMSQPGAILLSARPVVRQQEAALDDVRVERADNPMIAAALQSLMGATLLSPLRIDLLEAVRGLTAPDKTAPYAVEVRALELSELTVQNEELHVTVNGAVEIR
jgi:hypothetical protein